MSTNYYKNLWTQPDQPGSIFWKNVDFNHDNYKRQEQVFRQFLNGLKRLKQVYPNQKPIETVLEVGAGTGRMTKIMLEEFPNIKKYDIIDLNPQLPEQIVNDKRFKIHNMDLTQHSGVNLIIDGDKYHEEKYDFVLASEVFMHIKPDLTTNLPSKEISSIIKKYTNFLAPNGIIVNIDWFYQPEESEWCFIHDYDKMYRDNGLYPIFTADIKEIKQKLFCYGA